MENIAQTGATAMEVMFSLLWVSVLMWACIAVIVGNKMDKRTCEASPYGWRGQVYESSKLA